MAQLRADFTGLRDDFANMKVEVVGVRLEMARMNSEMARMNTEHSQHATRADVRGDVKSLEAQMKGWMLAITLSLVTSVFAMIYPLYGLLRNPPVVKPAQAQQIVSPPHRTDPQS